ncbi:hypothetical protein C5167_036945 [Papaver somniferum]|uniref:Uncharacterized protein n=1 Tax=Papaver somniferum TaxID=3469 RepID=A0A4Y7I838_PAPSO|nr:hypothetical protein C5167_036945 [Papaver somniferum]
MENQGFFQSSSDCDWGTSGAPNWVKCPAAVSFGSGGELVSYKNSQSATNPPTGGSELQLKMEK